MTSIFQTGVPWPKMNFKGPFNFVDDCISDRIIVLSK